MMQSFKGEYQFVFGHLFYQTQTKENDLIQHI